MTKTLIVEVSFLCPINCFFDINDNLVFYTNFNYALFIAL